MIATYNNYKKKHPRLTNHFILAGISLIGCIIATLLAPASQSLLETLSIGTGYVGLVLLAVTLLIGPFNMLKVRKNPVNLNFRRDAGIWAGITSLAHVVLAFAVELQWGSTLLGFFLYTDGSLKFNLFGVSNFIGLFAALVLIFLLVLSNNHFLKALKGKRWKTMQRFNYLLFVVALLHTFTQQVNNLRGVLMIVGVIGVTAAVMIGQSIGFVIYRRREQQRKAGAPVAKPAPAGAPAAKPAPARGPVAKPVPARGPVAIGQTLTPARIVVPSVRSGQVQGTSGLTRLKVASAVSLVALLGVGVGLESLSLINSQASATVSSTSSSESAPVDNATGTTAAATTNATVSQPSNNARPVHTGRS